MEVIYAVKGLILIGVWIAVIVVVSGLPKTKGRAFLLWAAILSLISTAGFAVSGYLGYYFGMVFVMQLLYVLLNLSGAAAAVCILLYVIDKKNAGNIISSAPAQPYPAEYSSRQVPSYSGGAAADTAHPLYGVNGWLKVVVVVNLYVAPALFVLFQLIAWTSYIMLASRFPGLIVVGFITTAVWGYLVYRGMQVARDLRDIKPGAVQNTRTFLKLCLVWSFLSIPISFLSGLDMERLIFEAVKTAVGSIAGFAIWYSYFNTSRRVEATYPDWKS